MDLDLLILVLKITWVIFSSIESCVSEGDKSSYEIGQEYSLESYNNPGFYMSHGSPSYLTDSLEKYRKISN